MLTDVAVDGFNLYFGALRNQPYRWLDLQTFSRGLLKPTDSLHRIRYFTARVGARPGDPSAPERRNACFRALGSIPNLIIHCGQFLSTLPRRRWRTGPVPPGSSGPRRKGRT